MNRGADATMNLSAKQIYGFVYQIGFERAFDQATMMGIGGTLRESDVFYRVDVAKLSHKGVHGIQCDFKVLGADVEVEKAMVAGIEIDQFAMVPLALHVSDKISDEKVGCYGITFAVHHQAWREFSANMVCRAFFF
jgi:hypothetical protein